MLLCRRFSPLCLFSLVLGAISHQAFAANLPTGVQLAKQQSLVRGNTAEAASLDPQKVEGIPELNIVSDLFEGLVTKNELGEVVPGVASKWSTNDNKTFVFELRKDAKWSDGSPITAEDFVYSYQRLVNPITASPYAWYIAFAGVKNAAAIIAGKQNVNTLGVKAVSPHVLEIDLERPVPYFLNMLTHGSMMPVPKQAITKYGDKWTKKGHIISNGAFMLDNWVLNERLVLTRNPLYWDARHTILEQVTYLPIEDRIAEMNRFLSGEIQMTQALPTEYYSKLKKDNPKAVTTKGSLCTNYYGLNTAKGSLTDARVRQALSYAIDRDVIAYKILGQGEKPAYFLTPESTANYQVFMPAYGKLSQAERHKKAVELLKDAGYDKANPLQLTILYNSSGINKRLAVAIQAMWKQTLGVDARLENQEWKTYLQTRRQQQFDVLGASWCGDYNEASAFLSLMESQNSSNLYQFNDTAYDNIMHQALMAPSKAKREQFYHQAEQRLADTMPIIPIYQYVKTNLVSPQLGGYPVSSAEDVIMSKYFYIKAK